MMFYTVNHTVAVIKGHETYDLLKSSCKDVFGYINQLLDEITTDGKDIPVGIFLGGDYKVYFYVSVIFIYNFGKVN